MIDIGEQISTIHDELAHCASDGSRVDSMIGAAMSSIQSTSARPDQIRDASYQLTLLAAATARLATDLTRYAGQLDVLANARAQGES